MFLALLNKVARSLRGRRQSISGSSSSAARLLEDGIAEHRARNWAASEAILRSVLEQPATARLDRQVARNILGNLLERTSRTDEAITLYRANVADRFEGSYSYERLAAIYRRRGCCSDEVAILVQAIKTVESARAADRTVRPRLERLARLLEEARRRESSG